MTTPSRSAPSARISRRRFVRGSAAALASAHLLPAPAAEDAKPFHLWACGDSHVGTDIKKGRESLADAIRQSEFGDDKLGAPPFDWDIAVHVGDLAGGQGAPDDSEGREVVKQFAALKKHRREDIYDLAGNHDASGPDEETQWWFKKWVDPTGENTATSRVDPAKRRYPVTGTWERYSFRVGNLLFLIMSDRNDGGPPRGRAKSGGYPAGAVTSETFAWWKQQVETNRDSIIICAHHHMLRETTPTKPRYPFHACSASCPPAQTCACSVTCTPTNTRQPAFTPRRSVNSNSPNRFNTHEIHPSVRPSNSLHRRRSTPGG